MQAHLLPLQQYILEQAKLSGCYKFSDPLTDEQDSLHSEESAGRHDDDSDEFADDEGMSNPDSSSQEYIDDAHYLEPDSDDEELPVPRRSCSHHQSSSSKQQSHHSTSPYYSSSSRPKPSRSHTLMGELGRFFIFSLRLSNINVVTQNHQGAIMTTLTVKKRMRPFTSTQWQLLLHQPVC